jgi:hypothetical protein
LYAELGRQERIFGKTLDDPSPAWIATEIEHRRVDVGVTECTGFAANDASLEQAYASGVPMGGDLKAPAGGATAPKFLIWAIKDPEAANLDRIQVIKGWTEGAETKEAIYDVVCADGRKAGGDGTCKVSPSTVDEACTPSTGHGAARDLTGGRS